MAWIELHETVREHPKTYALADALNITNAHAVGLVCCLWAWAIPNATDGVLNVPNRGIASAAGWEKKADALVKALSTCGWLDDRGDGIYIIHDWDEYACLLADNKETQKAKTAERVRKYRQRKKEKDVTECNALQALQVTEANGQSNAPTIPYLTLPLHEDHEETCTREDENGNPIQDPAWKQVSECYLREIGILGGGTSEENLQSYTDDLGPGVVCLAIRETNLNQPGSPMPFLLAILKDWAEAGIRDPLSAKAHLRDREKRRRAQGSRFENKPGATSGNPFLDLARKDDARGT